MAPMKTLSNNYNSSNYGEDVARQANVLASCYLVDSAGSLKGLHYCTTGVTGLPSPPSSPPLAAITSSNELALTPKASSHKRQSTSSRSRRGGATFRIREECERFFCETMRAVFLGERNPVARVSGLTGVHNDNDLGRHPYHNHNNAASLNRTNGNGNGYFASYTNNNGQLSTPPDDSPLGGGLGGGPLGCAEVTAWLEIWDYAGGASFRAFIAEDPSAAGEKALFAFFDQGVVGRDLKQALVALIELAETPLGCSQLVICLDRAIVVEEAQSLTKGLQWAGFSLTTLDHWVPRGLDVTSKSWLFMGMEI